MNCQHAIQNVDTELYVKTKTVYFGIETDDLSKATKYSRADAMKAIKHSKKMYRNSTKYVVVKDPYTDLKFGANK